MSLDSNYKDEKKIVYWELDGSKPVIYLDNGVILSLDNDKLTVKDYFSDIGYNYALSDDKKYKPEECAFIGDQIMTDVIGAKRNNLFIIQ